MKAILGAALLFAACARGVQPEAQLEYLGEWTTEAELALWHDRFGRPLILVGNEAYLAPLVCARELRRQRGSGEERRDRASVRESRTLGHAGERRDSGAQAERRSGGIAAEERSGGDSSERRARGGADEIREKGGDEEARSRGEGEEERAAGAGGEERRRGEAGEQRVLGAGNHDLRCRPLADRRSFLVVGAGKLRLRVYDGRHARVLAGRRVPY